MNDHHASDAVTASSLLKCLSGCLAIALLLSVPGAVYLSLRVDARLWILVVNSLFFGVGFLGMSISGRWFRFRRRNKNLKQGE